MGLSLRSLTGCTQAFGHSPHLPLSLPATLPLFEFVLRKEQRLVVFQMPLLSYTLLPLSQGFPLGSATHYPSPVCSVNSDSSFKRGPSTSFSEAVSPSSQDRLGHPSLALSNILKHLTHVLLIISHLLPTRLRLRPCLTACSQQLVHGWTDV